MTTPEEALLRFDEAIECARLLGITHANKAQGTYTQNDARFERAMHESIAKYRATHLDAPKQETPPGYVLVPAGWMVVPYEPTPEMCRALFVNLVHADNEAYVIKKVLAASPTPPKEPT